MRVQIRCIRKRPYHHDPHARIHGVGGVHDGIPWFLDEDTAIQTAEVRKYEFYVDVKGRHVNVIVASHAGRKYLKTIADDYAPDNLLALPECS